MWYGVGVGRRGGRGLRGRCPIVGTLSYLLFCFIGCAWKSREPVSEGVAKQAMRVYNLYQTIFNILCIYLCLRAHWDQKMKVWGNYTDFGTGGFGVSQARGCAPRTPARSSVSRQSNRQGGGGGRGTGTLSSPAVRP